MKVSVITVCKNSESTIERAAKSVIFQTYENREYIIIDGKSTDETLSIIEKYRDNINVLISESDTGIYNAMNKGMNYSTGDILYFLNSDDFLYDPDVIGDVVGEFRADDQLVVSYGNVIVDNDLNNVVKPGQVNRKFFYKNTICHQAVFARRETFEKIGNFDEEYSIHADVDWLMRVYFVMRGKFKYINRLICSFSTGGLCSHPLYAEKFKFDRQEISAKYFVEAKIKLLIKKCWFSKLRYHINSKQF